MDKNRTTIIAAVVLAFGAVALPAAQAFATPNLTESAYAQVHPATAKEVKVVWENQINGYYCGPAATRMALSPRLSNPPSQDAIAAAENTTGNGTDSVYDVQPALNKFLNTTHYQATLVDQTPSAAQQANFKKDLVSDIDGGWAIVANLWIPGGTQPRPPGYPNYEVFHYVTVMGYDQAGDLAEVADPAAGLGDFSAVPHTYWVKTADLVTWIGGRGYAH